MKKTLTEFQKYKRIMKRLEYKLGKSNDVQRTDTKADSRV